MSDGEWNADNCGDTEQYICEDLCPADTTKSLPGPCGCGVPEVDANNDGNPDCLPRPGDPGLPQYCRKKEFEGREYVFCDQQKTWDDARAMCQSMDMDLLVVDSASENEFATKEVDSPAWMAANDKLAEGEWRWVPTGVEFWRGGVDGRRQSTYYENWAQGAPGSNTSDCGRINSAGEWQDDNCVALYDVACEQRGLDNFQDGVAPAAGCVADTYGTHQYWVCPSAGTYFDARNSCTSVGGFDLASIETSDENAFLASKVPAGQRAWVGGNDVEQEGQWHWVSLGTSFWNGGASGAAANGAYTGWATGEPSIATAVSDCATTQSAGTWSARDCDSTQSYFICETVVLSWTAPDGQSEVEELPPPLSDTASAQLAQGFSWSTTTALPELDPDGNRALYYVMVYLRTKEEREALDMARVSYSFLPYFDEERRALWGGQVGVHMHELDAPGGGIFAYGIMLGRAYNMVRSAALQGEDVWDAVILRNPPSSVQTHPAGSIAWAALSDVGYEPPADPIPADALSAAAAGGTTSMTVWQSLAEGFEAMADWFREGIGNMSERRRGDTRITVRVVPHDVSDNFPGENNGGCPHSSCKPTLKRAWGKSAGAQIELPGIDVILKGRGTHTGRTGQYGFARITVAKDTDYDVCLKLENTNAEVATNFVATEAVLCDYRANVVAAATGTFSIGNELSKKQVGRYNSFYLHAYNRYVQTLALATDADYFMRDIIGAPAHPDSSQYVHLPIRAKILTGKHASGFFNPPTPDSPEGRSFTPCLGLPWPQFDTLVGELSAATFVGTFGVVWFVASIMATPLHQTDIVLTKSDAKRRGVIVHEWGHYAACKMLNQIDPDLGTSQLIGLMFASGDQEDQQPTAMAAEGFADFFASQVVGGTNYFWTREGTLPGDDFFMNYCDPNAQLSLGGSPTTLVGACLDDNIGGPSARTSTTWLANPYQHRIGRWATTLSDIFDGPHQESISPVDDLNSGAAWVQDSSGFTGSVLVADLPRPGQALCDPEPWTRKGDRDVWVACNAGTYVPDEEISLAGPDIFQLFQYWADDVVAGGILDGVTIHDDTWGRSIARLLQDRGYSDEEICRVFALHQEDGTCPRDLPVAQNAVPSRPYDLHGFVWGFPKGRWAWKDKSPVATGFEYTLEEISDQGVSTALDSGSLPLPSFSPDGVHRDASKLGTSDLQPDSSYRFRVATANGSVVGPYAEHLLTTPVEEIGSVACEALADAVDVDWRKESGQPFEGGRFQLQYRPVGTDIWMEARTVTGDDDVDGFLALTANDQIHGLDAERDYEVRVVSLTKDGTLGPVSPVEACTPIPPSSLFVSAATGDDNHASAGTREHPFETLEAAVVAANALDNAVWIQMASGTYAPTQFIHVLKKSEMATVRITGGYDEALGWTRGGAPTTIRVEGLGTVSERGPEGLVTSAGLVVDNDVLLKLQDLTVVVEPPSWTSGCVAGVYAEHLSLENTTLSVAGVEGGCRVGIQGYTKSIAGPGLLDSGLITIREGSRVFGTEAAGATASDGIVSYGIYSKGAEVIVTDSVVAAITQPGYAGTGPSVFVGISLIEDEPHVNALGSAESAGGQALTIARSFVETAYREPNFTFSSGFQAAVVSAIRRTTIHNSLLRSSVGGSVATVLMTAGNNREVELFYSTAIVGDDNEGLSVRPAGFRGSVYKALGSARRFECRNNALVYAAGIGTGDSIGTIFDFEELTSSAVFHQRLDVTANIFSTLYAPIVFCSHDETVGTVASEESSNSGAVYSCGTTPFAGAYTAAWNRKHYRPLLPGPDVGAGIATFNLDGFFEPMPLRSLSTTEHMRGQIEWLTWTLEPEIDPSSPILFDLGRRPRTFRGSSPNVWDGSVNDVGARVFGL